MNSGNCFGKLPACVRTQAVLAKIVLRHSQRVCRYNDFTPKTAYFTPLHHKNIEKIRYNIKMDIYIQKSAKGRRAL